MPKGVYERNSEEACFWEKVVIGDDDTCWLWTASTSSDGYGWFTKDKKTISAHRYSAILKYKELGDNLVRHTCDNRPCVNPNHLILGTWAENSADMVARNRQARGEKHHQATLTDAQAMEILIKYKVAVDTKNTYGILVKLAKEYNAPKQAIYRITSRQTYTHLVI